MSLTPFQCLLVGFALYLASKFMANVMCSLLLFVRYISALIALRYEYLAPRTSSPSSLSRYGFWPTYNDLPTIWFLARYALSNPDLFNTFMCKLIGELVCIFRNVQVVDLNKIWLFTNLSFRTQTLSMTRLL